MKIEAKNKIKEAIERIKTYTENGNIAYATECINEAIRILRGEPLEQINIYQVPYLSKYYSPFEYDINDEIQQEFYVTDYFQKEYMLGEEYAENFTITYWIDEKKVGTITAKSGDNFINIGKLSKGEHTLDFQATDQYGRKSCKCFTEFSVIEKGVDDVISSTQIYSPTKEELLTDFNIYSDNTNPTLTGNGLTNLIKYAYENGYKKLVLPQATYRVEYGEESGTGISIDEVDNFVLDLNNSTIKLQVSAYNGSIIKLSRSNNTKIINGTLEGDLDERMANSGSYPLVEFAHGLTFLGCTRCTLDNLTISKIVGYGISGGNGSTRSDYFSEGVRIEARRNGYWIPTCISGSININTGEYEENSECCCSENFIALQSIYGDNAFDYNLTKHRKFGVGKWGYGKGMIPTNESYTYIAHFYDENYNYIESITAYMYAKLRFSPDAKYVKFTFTTTYLDELNAGNIEFHDVNILESCVLSNIKLEHVRCVGIALSSMNNVLCNNIEFYHIGWGEAKCCWDCEDGWQSMQNLTVRHLKFIKGNGVTGYSGTESGSKFLNCAGHNFIAEYNDNFGSFQYPNCKCFKYRYNTYNFEGETRQNSGYGYFKNNICNNRINLKYVDVKDIVIRNNTITSSLYSDKENYEDANYKAIIADSELSYEYDIETNTYITSGGISNFNLKKCNITNMSGYICGSKFYDCVFNGTNQIISNNNSATNHTHKDANIFNNCTFNGISTLTGNQTLFNDCEFKKVKISEGGNILEMNNCTINVSDGSSFVYLKNSSSIYTMIFNNCTINDNTTKTMFDCQRNELNITFNNCTINKPNYAQCTTNKAIQGLYSCYYGIDTSNCNFTFNGCTVTEGFITEREGNVNITIK